MKNVAPGVPASVPVMKLATDAGSPHLICDDRVRPVAAPAEHRNGLPDPGTYDRTARVAAEGRHEAHLRAVLSAARAEASRRCGLDGYPTGEIWLAEQHRVASPDSPEVPA